MRFIGFGAQADFFHFDLRLRFLGFPFFFGTFINKLAIIDDTADGRVGVGGNFHKIQLGVACDLQCLSGGNNTDIAAIWPDQADFRDADALIDSKFCSADKLSPIAKQLTSPRLVFWRADNTMKARESSTK